jgi:hypothetical protein
MSSDSNYRLRAALAGDNDRNEAELRHFLAEWFNAGHLNTLLQVMQLLGNRTATATGLDRLAANLAVLELGQQLERLLSEEGGQEDGEQIPVD